MAEKIKTGDLVKYNGKIYYFKANGTSCYLFEKKEDIRDMSKKVCSPARINVEKYTPEKTPTKQSRDQVSYRGKNEIIEEEDSPQKQPLRRQLFDENQSDEEDSTRKKAGEEGRRNARFSNHIGERRGMLQQQKTEYVYIGGDLEMSPNHYKIGFTTNLEGRRSKFRTDQPKWDFIIIIKTEDARALEKKLHNEFCVYKYAGEVYKGLNMGEVKRKLKRWKFIEYRHNKFESTS